MTEYKLTNRISAIVDENKYGPGWHIELHADGKDVSPKIFKGYFDHLYDCMDVIKKLQEAKIKTIDQATLRFNLILQDSKTR